MDRVAALRLPAIYGFPETAEESSFAAYGPRLSQLCSSFLCSSRAEDFGRLGALQCTLRFIDRSMEQAFFNLIQRAVEGDAQQIVKLFRGAPRLPTFRSNSRLSASW
jgi:hypothetical protein